MIGDKRIAGCGFKKKTSLALQSAAPKSAFITFASHAL
jgi:hypothetical protein